MTRLYLSKLIRKINNNNIPEKCFANQYIPQSLNDVCDCSIFCKYNPKDGNIISIINKPQIKYNELTMRQ